MIKYKKEYKGNCQGGNTSTITFQTLSPFVFSFPNCPSSSLLKPTCCLRHGGIGSILRQTAQPRYALTFPKIKCKLYSKAIQTCQLRGFSCHGSVIGMMIRCFGVSGTCLNIFCDFLLDFDGHSSCHINLSWQHTQLIWEHSTMPWRVYICLPRLWITVASDWSITHASLLCSTDLSSQLFPPNLSGKKIIVA